MTLLTCMQTSSTMSICIINIINDHDHDPASPPLSPHLSSDDNNNNGHYTTTRTSSINSGKSAWDVSRLESLGMFFIYFSLYKFTTNEYIHFRLLTTTQQLPCHLRGDVAAISDTIELRVTDRLEKRQGEGMGLETRLVSSPWYVFFIFYFRPY